MPNSALKKGVVVVYDKRNTLCDVLPNAPYYLGCGVHHKSV